MDCFLTEFGLQILLRFEASGKEREDQNERQLKRNLCEEALWCPGC